ncbi:MAG: ImmA/IrrE family metallo-endopeptidase [candidate division Zixibacteria bacterium]|nr:ImmA/IrrE family metallo-endopeptidase [Candidatus Tariuqbacter arcticus]
MTNEQKAPYLNNQHIEKRAKDFLEQYHASGGIPIPIENIIEFDLELDIIPIPGLKRAFDVEAWISRDLKSITVDEACILKYPNRYRFSLAHELGHIFLHPSVFASANYENIEEYKLFQENIDPIEYSNLEWQANLFAALTLVPTKALKEKFDEGCKLLTQAGYSSLEDLIESQNFPQFVSTWMAKQFEVSAQVIIRRLKRERLIDPNYYF